MIKTAVILTGSNRFAGVDESFLLTADTDSPAPDPAGGGLKN